MKHRVTLAAGILAVSLGSGAGVAAAATAGASAPVIHERFTALPCTGSPAHRTTLQMQGCAEQAVLRADTRIDGLNRTIFGRLSASGRRQFDVATRDWVTYRDAECQAASSPDAGGTQQGVVEVQCLGSLDATHITDLHALQNGLAGTR